MAEERAALGPITEPWDPAVLDELTALRQRQPMMDGGTVMITLALGALRRSNGLGAPVDGESIPLTVLTLAWLNRFTELMIAFVTIVSHDPIDVDAVTVADAAWTVQRLGIRQLDAMVRGPEAKAKVRGLADSIWLSVPGVAEFCRRHG